MARFHLALAADLDNAAALDWLWRCARTDVHDRDRDWLGRLIVRYDAAACLAWARDVAGITFDHQDLATAVAQRNVRVSRLLVELPEVVRCARFNVMYACGGSRLAAMGEVVRAYLASPHPRNASLHQRMCYALQYRVLDALPAMLAEAGDRTCGTSAAHGVPSGRDPVHD